MAKELVAEVLDSGRLSYGPMTREFERRWAELHHVKHAIFTASGTCALQLALTALRIQRDWFCRPWTHGDEVLVPAVTFPATINTVLHAGLRPVLVDVDPDTLCMDPGQIEASVPTRCVLPVHLLGRPADMSTISQVANNHSIEIVEDSCQAVAVDTGIGSVGSVGIIGCFSTYISHHVSTGVGGFAVTNDDELAMLMRSLMNHGRHESYLNIDSREIGRRFEFHHVGYSWRCTELEAAIGLSQLSGVPQRIRRRRRVWRELHTALSRFPLQLFDLTENHCCLFFPIQTPEAADFITHLESRGVETRPLFPIITQLVYNSLPKSELPVARRLAREGLCIGCHPEMDVNLVSDSVGEFFSKCRLKTA